MNQRLPVILGLPPGDYVSTSMVRSIDDSSPNHKKAYDWVVEAIDKGDSVMSVFDVQTAISKLSKEQHT